MYVITYTAEKRIIFQTVVILLHCMSFKSIISLIAKNPAILLLGNFTHFTPHGKSVNGRKVVTCSYLWKKTAISIAFEIFIFTVLDVYYNYCCQFDGSWVFHVFITVFIKVAYYLLSILFALFLQHPSWICSSTMMERTGVDTQTLEIIDVPFDESNNQVPKCYLTKDVKTQTLLTCGQKEFIDVSIQTYSITCSTTRYPRHLNVRKGKSEIKLMSFKNLITPKQHCSIISIECQTDEIFLPEVNATETKDATNQTEKSMLGKLVDQSFAISDAVIAIIDEA